MPTTKRRGRRARRDPNAPPKIVALLALCPLYPEHVDGCCDACGKTLPKRRSRWCSRTCARHWRQNHLWNFARRAALTRDGKKCRACGCTTATSEMEVNHISPLNGSGYGMGCKHHQDNLETLCMACHSAVTAAQAAARAAARKAAKLAAIAAVAPVEVPVRKRRRKALIAEQVAA